MPFLFFSLSLPEAVSLHTQHILPPTLVVNKLQFATEAQVQVKHVGMAVSVQLTGQIIAYCSDLVCWTLKNYITFAQFFPETLAGVSSLSFPPKDNTY